MTKTPPNKWSLITGASSGIGRELALKMAKSGHNLVLVARREKLLHRLKQEILESCEVTVVVIAADLASSIDVDKIIRFLDSSQVNLDVLFNNAGFGLNGEFCEGDLSQQLKQIDVNCRALVQLSYEVGKRMKDQGRGDILHVASIGGLSPTPYYAVYGATKAFVISFSQALSAELKEYGVSVKVICPGATNTEFAAVSNFRGTLPNNGQLQSAGEVAEEAMRGLSSQKNMIIPGVINRISVIMMTILPRSITLAAAAKALRPK